MNKKNSNLSELNGKLEWKTFYRNATPSVGIDISPIMNNENDILVVVYANIDGIYRRFSKRFIAGFDISSNVENPQYFPMGGYAFQDSYYFCGLLYNPTTGILKCDAFTFAGTSYLNSASMWIFYH